MIIRLVDSFQTRDTLPSPFDAPNTSEDSWSPLRFNTPNAWHDGVAEDMWRNYVASGDFVEMVMPF